MKNRRPGVVPQIIANRVVNKAVREGRVAGWGSNLITVEEAYDLIVEALIEDRKG